LLTQTARNNARPTKQESLPANYFYLTPHFKCQQIATSSFHVLSLTGTTKNSFYLLLISPVNSSFNQECLSQESLSTASLIILTPFSSPLPQTSQPRLYVQHKTAITATRSFLTPFLTVHASLKQA
jgi:hypothetical protein